MASLVDSSRVIEDDFVDKGFNLRPLFSQLISSNLDMDRPIVWLEILSLRVLNMVKSIFHGSQPFIEATGFETKSVWPFKDVHFMPLTIS